MRGASAAARSAITVALGLLAAGWLNGCKHAPPPPPAAPKPKSVAVSIACAPDTNPNDEGRPSPVVVHLYVLKDAAALQRASFDQLTLHADTTLAASLLAQEQREVRPGETQSLQLTIDPSANFVGVVAEFSHALGATWKAVTPPQPKPLVEVLAKLKVATSQSVVAVELQ
jgi:type VI secretion system protein VasD